MRVISGKYKGKRLAAPEGNRVRPTSDRIKETLFNILVSKGYGEGMRVLDLFAGTGALGIEALSRGAAECVFVDIDRESLKYVRENLKTAGADAEVYHADYGAAIVKLAGREFDLIFIDPPYKKERETPVLIKIEENRILAEGGIAVVEHDAKNKFSIPEYFDAESRICGNTALTFLRRRKL